MISLTFQDSSCLTLKMEYEDMSTDLINWFLRSENKQKNNNSFLNKNGRRWMKLGITKWTFNDMTKLTFHNSVSLFYTAGICWYLPSIPMGTSWRAPKGNLLWWAGTIHRYVHFTSCMKASLRDLHLP